MAHRSDTSDNLLYAALAGVGVCAAATLAMRWSRRFDFNGKVVLITGGSRGLGLVLARQFAIEGARLAICARDPEELTHAVDDLASNGVDVLAVPCDIGSQDDVARMVGEVVSHFGGVDVLVNNAGTIAVGPMETMTVADYEEAMKTHFWGPLYTTLAVLPHLRNRGGGRIVNVSSIGGKVAVPHLLSYSPSKFAAVGLSEGLRAELAPQGVHVVTVIPGLMRTGSYSAAYYKGDARLEYSLFAPFSSSPLNTVAGARAARRIVRAIERREPEVTIGVHARLLARANGVAPGLTADALALVSRLLPRAEGPTDRLRGADIAAPVDGSPLMLLGRRAQSAFNQLPRP
jgi:NAD(P)-dependent dehydrogenase (short-subunit alcohol dehydrogenase family)